MKLAKKVNSMHEKMDDVLKHYLIALLWASTDDNEDPLDDNYSVDDFTRSALDKSKKDIATFKKKASKELEQADVDDEQLGHDIALSRNRHGAGFFDRDYADQKILDKLQDHAEALGEVHPWVNADGNVEVE